VTAGLASFDGVAPSKGACPSPATTGTVSFPNDRKQTVPDAGASRPGQAFSFSVNLYGCACVGAMAYTVCASLSTSQCVN
jgi:hypothetical protein